MIVTGTVSLTYISSQSERERERERERKKERERERERERDHLKQPPGALHICFS